LFIHLICWSVISSVT